MISFRKKTSPSEVLIQPAGVFGRESIPRRNEFYYPETSLEQVRRVSTPVTDAADRVVELLKMIAST